MVFLLPMLIACAEAPQAPPGPILGVTHLRAFHSTDLELWQPAEAPELKHAMSLGLHPIEGGFEVTFMDLSGGERSWWERVFGSPSIGTLRRTETGWTRGTRSVSDPDTPAPIDPQGEGDQLWFVARDGQHGDPAAGTSSNRIRTGPPWKTVAEGAGITDPMPLQFRDERLLFVTENHQRVLMYRGDMTTPERRWDGITVPFATIINNELWLIGQAPTPGSRLPRPVAARSSDGRNFSDFKPMLPSNLTRVCTSPVLGSDPKDGGWLLLCIQESAPGARP